MSDNILGDKSITATDLDVDKALGWMSGAPMLLAQAIANRQHAEAWIKAVEATEKARHATEPAHVQEREARASEAYGNAIDAYRDASREEQRLRYTWQFAETLIEVWRTKCANERKV